MKSRPVSNPVHILLVEDNPADVDLVREVFGESKLANRISVAQDGMEALAFLRKEAEFKDATTPDLVLLDLNIPKKDGRQVLAEIKGDPALMQIPVLVLTSSAAERDLEETYRLHANCFLTKPGDLDAFLATLRSIETFWLGFAKLPQHA